MDSLGQAVNDRPFQQTEFMSERSMASFLRDRGLDIGTTGIRALVECGVIKRLGHQTGDFHPFQVWPISQFIKRLNVSLAPAISYFGLDVNELQQFFSKRWPYLEEQIRGFSQSPVCREFDQLLPLLLWLESYYLPFVRGPRPDVISFVGADLEGWEKWRKETNPIAWLDEFNIKEEQLSAWRQGVLQTAESYDPATDWYLLIRSIPSEIRFKIRGTFLLAYDLYEIAEMVRVFLEKAFGKSLTKEWDPRGHPDAPWANRFYGVAGIRPGSAELNRSLIRRFGLDPTPRVLWLVEGATELSFIHEYSRGLGIPVDSYAEFREFSGDGALKKQLQVINQDLISAAGRQQFVTVTFDEAPASRQRIRELLQQKLITLRFVMNSPDFEGQNFSIEELLNVTLQWAREEGVDIPGCVTGLTEQIEKYLNSKKVSTTKAIDYVLKDYHWGIDKGNEWGGRLARLLLQKREDEVKMGTYTEKNLSKIEKQVIFTLQSGQPHIDYKLSIEHMDFRNLEIIS
ncbi:MAG TPA: hypothetical protein VEG28_03930 [Dehalococcoidia bacterium]|nr:hypothetical protein [Dehalococcoidia bacterium]